MSAGSWSDGTDGGFSSGWSLPQLEAAATSLRLLRPVLGIVRGVDGAAVTVEVAAEAGGLVQVELPAVHATGYAAGDRVLVIFTGDEAGAAVVAGRVGALDDSPAGANVLAALLGVDGPGSGLDADTLDGSHEAALLRADGSRPLSADWDAGAGRALRAAKLHARDSAGLDLADSGGAAGLFVEQGGHVGVGHRAPQCPLDVRLAGDGLVAYFLADDGDTAGLGIYLYTDDFGTTYLANTAAVYAPTATGALILAAAASGSDIRFTTGGAPSATTERMRVTAAGLGIGTAAPQGRLHLWDGTGGMLVASRTAIGATAQGILPAGTGDVALLARVEAIVSNGAAAVYEAFTLAGTSSQTVTVGADSYQFRRNADGSLDVRRTAGSSAGAAVVRALWL